MPLGYSYGRDSNNSPILKLVTPNMLKIGRLNSRSLQGPIRFPTGPKELLKKVHDTYDAFYKIWNITMIPKLIPQPVWFKSSPELKPSDIIYFQKVSSDLSGQWTLGQVEDVTRSKDGVIRRANIRYTNAGENGAKFTDRAVRSLVRLFNVEDSYFVDDMAEVEKYVASLDAENTAAAAAEQNRVVQPVRVIRSNTGTYSIVTTECHDQAKLTSQYDCDQLVSRSGCDQCCCVGHCALSHYTGADGRMSAMATALNTALLNGNAADAVMFPDDEDIEAIHDASEMIPDVNDDALAMLTALETKFDL